MHPVLILLLILLLAAAGFFGWMALQTRRFAREAESAVPQAGRIVPVTGGAIHYVEAGARDKPDLVLIHGISAQLQHFTYAVTELLKDDFHIIALDRPGCGYSERAADADPSPEGQARMISEFLDTIGVERPMVAGHSLGGAVTLALALQRPEAIRAMALISPLTHVETEVGEAFKGLDIRSPAIRSFVGHTIAVPVARKTASRVLALAFAPESAPADFLTRAGAALGLRPKAFITASANLVSLETAMPRQVTQMGALTVPGGVLFGSDDPILNPEVHGRPMTDYGLAYETLEGRGHMLPITCPQECADFIRRMAATG